MGPTNAKRVIAALKQFGFGTQELTPDDFLVPDQIIQLGYPPNRIAPITTPVAVDFETCYAVREKATIDGVSVNFVDFENLKKNKTSSGRAQDIADVSHLT